jgi:HEAT repeat protein
MASNYSGFTVVANGTHRGVRYAFSRLGSGGSAAAGVEGIVLAALRGTDDAARIQALVALGSGAAPIDIAICRALIELLGKERKEIRRYAADALARAVRDPKCRAMLADALLDADARRRWCACFALERAGVLDAPVVDAALEALGSDDGDVRWAAAEIVCRAVKAEPALLASVRAVVHSDVTARRKMALYCLRDTGVVDESAFIGSLHDADRGVRMAALAGLSRCVSQGAAEAIASLMEQDADDGVRRAAAATLGRRSDLNAALRDRIARAEGTPNGPRSAQKRDR